MARLVSSKHVENVSDLTLAAPIKMGFVDAVDNVTYESRLRLVMGAMFQVRATAREYAKIKPFVESAERIQSLLDFRLAIIDGFPQKKLLLSVAFDRGFEPYMRLVWDPLGPLLDLFFCNCDGYVVAAENSFPDYMKWVRSVQIDSDFFYAASNRTIVDGEYLAHIERLHRDGGEPDPTVAAASHCVPLPWIQAKDVQKGLKDAKQEDLVTDLGVQALAAVGRLFDLYPPDDPKEFKFLQRAASRLLEDWNRTYIPLPTALEAKLAEYLPVLGNLDGYKPPKAEAREPDPENVQGGIISAYDEGASAPDEAPLTHACLLLMRIKDPSAARRFLGGDLLEAIDRDGRTDPDKDKVNLNVAFTFQGLKRLGVPATELDQLPQEFREGMEARAGILGDIGDAHPRRWTLPVRCKAGPGEASAPVAIPGAPPVQLSEVDVVLKLRTKSAWNGHQLIGEDEHPLVRAVARLLGDAAGGLELLAVEAMRNTSADADGKDHFGFKDGLSQPHVRPHAGSIERDKVSAGEILIGFPNDRKDPAPPHSPFWDEGSFLVVRKLRQDVERLADIVEEKVDQLTGKDCAGTSARKDRLREAIYAQIMGRDRNGATPILGASGNDFDYTSDPRGQKVPFQAHVRRTHPRLDEHGRKSPRILRRGLSYGPPRGQGTGERGIVFMAYNASIAEQFEVIQSWIAGGNSTRVASCQSDPLMGPARHGDPRTFLFRIDGEPVRLTMQDPVVKLQWGTYLFVPSLAGLRRIASDPVPRPDTEALEGVAIIERIAMLPRASQALAWKTAFEDMIARDPDLGGVAPKVWAAIRARGGAMRVPYGDPPIDETGAVREAVLVASVALANAVLEDDRTYSVAGYCPRLDESIGMIYLGRDDGPEYRAESGAVNAAISAVTAEQSYGVALALGRQVLTGLRKAYVAALPGAEGGVKIDLVNEYITGVLAFVCHRVFGLPDEPLPGEPPAHFEIGRGPWRWTPHAEREPVCPGDFIAPSSYIFYLDPIRAIVRRGTQDGAALRKAAERYFQAKIDAKTPPVQPIARAVWDTFAGASDPADAMARTLIGVMMGFLPPADGNLRGIFYDWLKSEELWRIQHELLTSGADRDKYEAVAGVIGGDIKKAMQKRPAPDALWRTATKAATIGPVEVRKGDKIYVGIASATAEIAKREGPDAQNRDIWPIFGGNRGAAKHPTHACPGYEFAMGVITGAVCALLEVGRIEAMPAPLIVSVPRP
jgi:Dyp-type peroxidase family